MSVQLHNNDKIRLVVSLIFTFKIAEGGPNASKIIIID